MTLIELSFSTDEMLSVPILNFLPGMSLPLDVFVRLPNGKYVQIARKGDQTPTEQFQNYKQKNIDSVYVNKKDYEIFVEESISVGNNMINTKNLPTETKAEVIKKCAVHVINALNNMGFNERLLKHAQKICNQSILFASQEPDLFKLLETLNHEDVYEFNHAIGVANVSIMLAKHLNLASDEGLEHLGLACLLHDIGKQEIPEKIINLEPDQMTNDQLQLYQSHPHMGYKMLSEIPYINEDVLRIVRQHHENVDGSGYPQGLKEYKIHPLANIVALTNRFCDLCLLDGGPQDSEKLHPAQALSYIQDHESTKFNRSAFQALVEIILVNSKEKSA